MHSSVFSASSPWRFSLRVLRQPAPRASTLDPSFRKRPYGPLPGAVKLPDPPCHERQSNGARTRHCLLGRAGSFSRVTPEPRVLSMTHYSPLTGNNDVPENYHTLVYTLTPTDSGTRLELTQDGCDSDEQATQFSQNWQGMLDSLGTHVEKN